MLPKTAGSAQTHKSISFIWIVWSTLYVYLCLKVRILPFLTTFTYLTARLKRSLRDWSFTLDLKEGQVKCAMVCVERGHILLIKHVDSFRRDFFYYLLQGKNCYFETNILSHICKYLYQDIWFCIWLYHGSYKWIIMLEKCGRPDSNGFQLKVWHQWQLQKSKSW